MDVREKLVELANDVLQYLPWGEIQKDTAERIADRMMDHGVTVIPPGGIGEMSDGYHTFDELYHHRAVLFSVICNAMPEKAWKSKRHDTGDMYDGMFIVGIKTNHGQATYHYDVDPYWDMFNVPELEYAPKWDGHTPQEAINRIAHGVTVQEWISVKDRLPEESGMYITFWCTAVPVRWLHNFDKDIGRFGAWWNYEPDGKEHPRYRFIEAENITHWMPLPKPPKGE